AIAGQILRCDVVALEWAYRKLARPPQGRITWAGGALGPGDAKDCGAMRPGGASRAGVYRASRGAWRAISTRCVYRAAPYWSRPHDAPTPDTAGLSGQAGRRVWRTAFC